jgi:YjbE family integral membrane protein
MTMDFLLQTQFWISVLQIIAIDILLGGDNAVVIALACRKLPVEQRNRAIVWGVVGAIGLRIALIFIALKLLLLPYLKIVGALLLAWIGIKLQHDEDDDHEIEGASNLLGAIRTIVVADAVMSMDNVIAVAGAAKGDLWMVIFGILVSIPIIVWGSKLVLALMERFPLVVTLGAALLGWIAGTMLIGDAALASRIRSAPAWFSYACGAIGVIVVVAAGQAYSLRARSNDDPT